MENVKGINKTRIFTYLDDRGISRSLTGYSYLVDAICFMMEHPASKMTDVYGFLSDSTEIPSEKIQGCIRYALICSTSPCAKRPREFVKNACYTLLNEEVKS